MLSGDSATSVPQTWGVFGEGDLMTTRAACTSAESDSRCGGQLPPKKYCMSGLGCLEVAADS